MSDQILDRMSDRLHGALCHVEEKWRNLIQLFNYKSSANV